MLRLVFVHIILSSIWIAEWPPFRKKLLTRLTIYSLCFVSAICLVLKSVC